MHDFGCQFLVRANSPLIQGWPEKRTPDPESGVPNGVKMGQKWCKIHQFCDILGPSIYLARAQTPPRVSKCSKIMIFTQNPGFRGAKYSSPGAKILVSGVPNTRLRGAKYRVQIPGFTGSKYRVFAGSKYRVFAGYQRVQIPGFCRVPEGPNTGFSGSKYRVFWVKIPGFLGQKYRVFWVFWVKIPGFLGFQGQKPGFQGQKKPGFGSQRQKTRF